MPKKRGLHFVYCQILLLEHNLADPVLQLAENGLFILHDSRKGLFRDISSVDCLDSAQLLMQVLLEPLLLLSSLSFSAV